MSYKFSNAECRWSTREKEAYAINYSVQKLDHYLQGAEFVVRTDHTPLKYFLESPMQNKKVLMWALSIAGYNCKIEYIEGTSNTVADPLSHSPRGHPVTLDRIEEKEEVGKNK